MSRIYAKQFLLYISFIVINISAAAQNTGKENTPYSRFGLGQPYNGLNTSLKGMASLSSAYSSYGNVNTDNPASYAALLLTTYEAGMEASSKTISSGNDKYKTGTASLSYFNIGIPLGKHGGLCLGVRPQFRTYYRLDDTGTFPGFAYGVKSFQGTGGLTYGFIGGAYSYKGFSLGVNVGYLFGTITNGITMLSLQSVDSAKVFETVFLRATKIGGVYWKTGAQYEHKIKKGMSLRTGATLSISQNLNATRDELFMSRSAYTVVSGGAITNLYDTVSNTVGTRGKMILPMSYSVGVQLVREDKWTAGVDFSGAQWSQFRTYGLTDSVSNSYKVAVGGEYTPNVNSLHNYFQRVSYRLGFYMGTDMVYLSGNKINYYAFTGGFSLPFRRGTDRIHTAVEVGSRGTTANGLLRENFIKFSVGLSLNDRWFIKKAQL